MPDPRTFWTWFSVAVPRLQRFKHGRDEALLDELQDHLQSYSSGLWFEIGGHPDGPMELVISAEGDTDYFDDVKALVASAPSIDGWTFVAFKPAQGFGFTTEYEGITVDPAKSWFLPMHSTNDPSELGLRVAVPGFNAEEAKSYRAAVYIVIETGLGELRAWEAIKHVEVTEVPASPESEGYIELHELERYLDWRARSKA